MFDTINFKLTRAEVEGVDFLSEITPYLDPDTIGHHNYGGMPIVTGKTGNLCVSISPNCVKIKDGSLCKWHLGDNYMPLNRTSTRQAIERLSDMLHLPMDKAIITRLDVGFSIQVTQPPCNYFSHLGTLAYAQRLEQDSGIYYYLKSKAERLCFYDKNREQRAHKAPIPEQYRDCNVLRYEQRYMARLPSLLNEPHVTGAMLYDEKFYMSLLNRWRDTYRAIRKINDITLNFQAMRNKRQFHKMGVLAMVERVGGEIEMLAQITEAQKRGDLTAKQAFNLRQEVKEACKIRDGLTIPNDCTSELNKKIDDVVMSNLSESI